jgi:hypothetical protein
LIDKLDYDSLSPVDKLAIDSAAREYLAYVLSLPKYKNKYKKLIEKLKGTRGL